MPNLVFYDFETCSSNVSYGQIIQAAAVLVNDKFQELDRYEGRCRLSPGIIPEAMALIVNKTTPQILKETNLSHYQMIRQMMGKFNKWKNSIFIGWNNINFDREFLRRTLFKNLDYPYLTVTNGNEEGDLFNIARAAHLYYPGCIKTPISDKNNPVFKLDKLAPMNGINHDDAHSAISDVLATVEIAKILSKNAPNVWKSSLMTTNKDKTLQIIRSDLTFCTDFFYYGKSFPFILTFVCEHPQWGYPMCFDLKADPKFYFKLSINELRKELKKTPKVIRTIKQKKHPILMNSSYGVNFEKYKDIGVSKINERAELIRSNKEFINKVISILDDEASEKKDYESQEDIYPEESIYKEFTSKEDNAIMPSFHKADWKEKFLVLQKFKDQRLRYFGKKILYEESPESLPQDEYDSIHKEVSARVLSTNKENWNTIPRTYSEIDTLRNKFKDDKDKLNFLDQINIFIEELAKKYEMTS
ncbi:MAG: exodeoxyribonuclease I [Candidatus Pelagibacter sp. TMED64]|nr:exodeoxyribonuclease I [Candidatus Pelagibacter sp.]OUU65000.1 MAG: exodeoxyribonuclease I [Candidatus Pelagibacter sp. TMED64]|tara:strand:- start:12691 stop:14109 length:1419 start_codon:yes stop_codon:yes gene_type:complete